MDFLIEMEVGGPSDPEVFAELAQRERAAAAALVERGDFFKEVWIVPCQRSRLLICSAKDAADLHETFASLPGTKWNKLQATPLVECELGSSINIVD